MADDYVTDPALLSQLGAPSTDGYVTDPAVLAKLNEKPQDQSTWDAVKHLGGMAARVGVNTVAALPMMAEDFGVGARNLYGKLTGGSSDYEYPSDTLHKAEDQYFGKPQGTAENIEDVVGPVVGGIAGSKSLSPLVQALAGSPKGVSSADAPASFVTPQQTKNALLATTLKNSQDAGYVVPPSTTNPTALNHVLETTAGKVATQQAASVKNQTVTNRLASSALGLNPDAPITTTALDAIRAQAGQAYEGMRNIGQIVPDDTFRDSLQKVRDNMTGVEEDFPGSKPSPLTKEISSLLKTSGGMDPLTLNQKAASFDASNAVSKIKQLRDSADVAGRAGDKGLAKGYKDLADSVEAQIDRSVQARMAAGDKSVDPQAVSAFQNARKTIAKTYSVQDALNPATGDVSATKLAASGDPLSDELKTAADFARAVPKAAQDAAKVGSHGVSHLDMMGTLLAGTMGEHAAHGPAGMLAGAAYPLARMGSKAYLLSEAGQAGAIPKAAAAQSAAKPAAGAQATIPLARALAAFYPDGPEHKTTAIPAH